MTKQLIELDASAWKKVGEFYDDLLRALAAPDWHSYNLNSFVDSMIYGGINKIDQPYVIKLNNMGLIDSKTAEDIMSFISAIKGEQEIARNDGFISDIEFVVNY